MNARKSNSKLNLAARGYAPIKPLGVENYPAGSAEKPIPDWTIGVFP
jgi:hypothetical protein